MVLPQVTNFEDKSNGCTVLERSRRRWLNAFLFSAIVGAVMGGTGMMISVLVSFHFLEFGVFLDRVDTALIAAAFPIIVFAAHSLDKAEEAKRTLKAISYRDQKQ